MKKGIKIILIVAGSLLVLGLGLCLGALISVGFDLSKIQTTDRTEIRLTPALQSTDSVSIRLETETLQIGLSPDGETHLTYFDEEDCPHTYSLTDGVLSLESSGVRRPWYKYIHFGFNFSNPYVELLLPDDFNGMLRLETSTGSVSVKGLSSLSGLTIQVTTGGITLENLTVPEATIESTTGSVRLNGVTADSLTAETTTGSIHAEDVRSEKFRAVCTTGSIRFSDLDSGELILCTSTGSIRGNLLRPESQYEIRSETSTGSCNLPASSGGAPGSLTAKTSTGSIRISFSEQ